MSEFKTQLASDVSHVFLNSAEFAEEISFNGQTLLALIDDSQGGFKGASRDSLENVSGLGILQGSRTLYLKDVPEERPLPGQEVEINGEIWIVESDPASVHVDMGMLVLRLSRAWS